MRKKGKTVNVKLAKGKKTERKQAEVELEKSVEMYRSLAENTADVLLRMNLKGNFTYMGKNFESATGYSRKEIENINIKEFLTPESYKLAMGRMREWGKGAKSLPPYEIEIKTKDGRIIPFEINTSPIIEGGKLKAIQIVARNITERKRAEEKTKQLQKYLHLQVDRMPIGLIVWDKEFRVKTWNPAAMKIFGFTEEEALGKHAYDLVVPKEAQPYVDDIWRRLLEGDLTAYAENENITKDGRTIICDWANTPLKEADGTVMGILSMVRDITERKNAEKKMREFVYKVNNISPGECYLHKSSDAVYNIFTQLVLHGVPGLCISREKPEKLIKYGIPKERIILISSTPLKGFKAIENLQEISLVISDFLKKHTAPIVLLDGLAYMISRFDFKPMFKFIQEKRFNFIETGATLLMPVNLAAFTEKERSLLTSEAKLLG